MNKSENINELAAALAKAQGEMRGAVKDSNNPFFSSKYADLTSCWEACRIPLSKNGLSIIQLTIGDAENVSLETVLTHSSGQWISSIITMKPGYVNKSGEFIHEKDAQAFGSCLTYSRRYALSAMVGIAPEDDDGNASVGGKHAEKKQSYAPHDEPIQPDRDLKAGADSIVISEPQRKRLFAISKKHNVGELSLKNYLKKFGVDSTKNIQRKDYEAICGMVESGALSDKEGVQHEPEELRV